MNGKASYILVNKTVPQCNMSSFRNWSGDSQAFLVSVTYIKYIYKFIKKNNINSEYHFGKASFGNDTVSELAFTLDWRVQKHRCKSYTKWLPVTTINTIR